MPIVVPATGGELETTSLCYPYGTIGFLLVYTAANSARALWLGVAWYAARSSELYYLLASQTLWISLLLHYILRQFVLPDHTSAVVGAHTRCNGAATALPYAVDLVTWLLFHYWVFAVIHERHAHMRLKWRVTLRRIAYGVGMPLVLWWSGNATLESIATGAGIGVLVGALSASLLMALWAPRIYAVHRRFPWSTRDPSVTLSLIGDDGDAALHQDYDAEKERSGLAFPRLS